MLVRFMETWAIPYSLINQPIALQCFKVPGCQVSFPSIVTFRPFSRTSKDTALALRTEVVLRLKFTAIRKSRAPITVKPEAATFSEKMTGPKSGVHSESFSFACNPSYSPARHTARFLRLSVKAASS